MQESPVPWVRKIPWRRKWLPTLLPKSLLFVHQCQTEIWENYGGERKSGFITCQAKKEHNRLVPQELWHAPYPSTHPPWVWKGYIVRLVQNWERSTQGCILSPCLFNIYRVPHAKCWTGWKASWESILPGEISITSDMTSPLGREGRGNKEPLNEGEEESEKAGLKQHAKNEDRSIWSHHFMTNRWGNNGNSDGFYFLGLQNTA